MRLRSLLAAGLLSSVPLSAQTGPASRPTGLQADTLALACAPSLAFETPATPLRVTGGQDTFVRRIYQPGDLITINAGTENGMAVGQEFYTRRVQVQGRGRVSRERPGVIRTSGWIRVYAVDTRMSLATITHACDTVQVDDYLEPFTLPETPAFASREAKAERDNYGRVMLGTDRRASFGKGDFMIVDRGSEHGITRGAQFVVYRDKRVADNFMFELGEAVAVDVKPATSTLWVTLSRDAIAAGDYVALRR
jgi:hypothetical protein